MGKKEEETAKKNINTMASVILGMVKEDIRTFTVTADNGLQIDVTLHVRGDFCEKCEDPTDVCPIHEEQE